MFFHKSKAQTEQQVDHQWGKKMGIGIVVLFFLLLIAIPLVESWGIFSRIVGNWQELQFTYNHPQFVKVIHEQFDTQQKQLEQTFSQKQQSAQDNLLNAVANQLNSKN